LENLVILDIRDPYSYAADHIPGAINEPFITGIDSFCLSLGLEIPISRWITTDERYLLLELPDDQALFDTIGSLGITQDSRVVIVTAPSPLDPAPFYRLANGARVADTLIYAGVDNVAILDGGYPKWVADGYGKDSDVPIVVPVTYDGTVNRGMFVSINYVRRNLWRADIIDARDADVYFGVTIEPFAPDAGHIPGATSLPAPWGYISQGDNIYTFKDTETLGEMASGVIGDPWYYYGHWSPKIIVYCGAGGYASVWWFVLTQVLEYKDVKFYDGSAKEWIMEGYDMVPYQWD
jgi:thiosulfate/3-mercaptopyruvate sulfurtransferase